MTTDTRPPLDLDPDGPHTPERIRALADTAAECIRALNHATTGDALTYPGEAYSLLGALDLLAGRLPQLCHQISYYLTRAQAAGHIAETPDGPYLGHTEIAVAAAGEALLRAADAATAMGTALGEAQSAIRSVGYAGPDERAAWAAQDEQDDIRGAEQ